MCKKKVIFRISFSIKLFKNHQNQKKKNSFFVILFILNNLFLNTIDINTIELHSSIILKNL